MTNQVKSFAELANLARQQTAYHVQGPILEFTEEVVLKMREQDVSKADLAKKLNTSAAYISKMLGGNNNFTLETMVKVAQALECDLRVHLQSQGTISQWFDLLDGGQSQSNQSTYLCNYTFEWSLHGGPKCVVPAERTNCIVKFPITTARKTDEELTVEFADFN